MYLQKLELHGFKSFAQNTALEFQRGVCAVVGPNGSGKSNIADALRFVLGEQSMKNIRSKKGEDLIFSGSASKPRQNMASVAIHFDNTDKAFPLDFEAVIIKRKIFRDGENQYFINNAQVRLKDVAELIAKARLGLRGYTVINQGMGDVILSASPKERKEIIFDALGLREFQMKKTDAIAKLAQTRSNTEKAESVLRELAPHLRFLKKQVEKMEERDDLRIKLSDMENRFLRKKMMAVDGVLNRLEGEINSEKSFIDKAKRELEEANNALDEENKKIMQSFADVPRLEESLIKMESERNSIEREIGKIEGAIAFARQVPRLSAPAGGPEYKSVDLAYVEEKLNKLNALLDDALRQTDFNTLSEKLKSFSAQFSEILGLVRERRIPVKQEQPNAPDSSEYEEKRKSLLELLAESDQKLKSIKEEIRSINAEHGKERERVFELKNIRRELEIKLAGAEEKMSALGRERDRISRDKQALEMEKSRLEGYDLFVMPAEDELFSAADDEVIRDIERIKLKLENIDLIDQGVKTEFEEAQKRHDFLTKELGDLEQAVVSLKSVIAELDDLISDKFKIAFGIINKNFHNYFNTLFEGGRAGLELVADRSDQESEEAPGSDDRAEAASDYGIAVEVSLPRKKAAGLAMLSGGERALTSLALIFALVSTSPPPFLVLDEIDAPLDEANSMRFGKIIGELKDRTQFIVITHNRETMRQSDALFGVTMQEDGVSKLLSLKFDESLQYAA